ncbi:Spindle and kinetochore-associated protein 1 [Dermatophagoides pteronyssinus]|uniref:SKA complex subunit 1 n=1 Tax=Dermatophagoides pteronyssinus TaxID=6956 RepID=A0ABQ8JPS6_DERPT|nr:Spindle and kinetochore-associated protein 1 [Dermatophagoides pteronyssinus]
MDSPDLNELFSYFDQKISNATSKLAMLNVYYQKDRNECIEMNVNIGSIQYLLHSIDQCLIEAENEFEIQTKRCDNLLQLLEDHIDHIEANLPMANLTEKQTDNQKSITRNITYTNMDTKKIRKTNVTTKTSKSNQNREPPKEIESKSKPSSATTSTTINSSSSNSPFPLMEHLNQSEYNSIPKYMLSRLTLSTLNESIDAFNHSIYAKYQFIKKFDIQSTKESDYKRYQQYKSQENADTKGIYFVTINDIKELTEMKNDSTLRKVLICLRHCKRIKEIRGGNGQSQKLIRYGLI